VLPRKRLRLIKLFVKNGNNVKEASLEAFDFLIVTCLNIGKFFGKNDGTSCQIRHPKSAASWILTSPLPITIS